MTPHPKQLRFKQNVYATKLLWMIVPYWLLIFFSYFLFIFFFEHVKLFNYLLSFFLPVLGMSR